MYITKAQFINASFSDNPIKSLIKNTTPSLSHIFFDARSILRRNLEQTERNQIFNCVKRIHDNYSHNHFFLIDLIIRIKNLIMGWGFCTPQQIYKTLVEENDKKTLEQSNTKEKKCEKTVIVQISSGIEKPHFQATNSDIIPKASVSHVHASHKVSDEIYAYFTTLLLDSHHLIFPNMTQRKNRTYQFLSKGK